jgi:hypothetical protein
MRLNCKIGMRLNHKIGMRRNLNFEKGKAMSAHAKKGLNVWYIFQFYKRETKNN